MRAVVLVCVAVVVLTLAAAVGLGWQANRDAVPLDALRSRFEAAIRSRLPPDATVAIGSSAVSYRRDLGMVVKARDVRLGLPGAATISAAEIATTADLSSLVHGRIDLSTVTVSGVDIAVSAPSAIQPGGAPADMVRKIGAEVVQQIARTDDLLRGAGLRDVTIKSATVRLAQGGLSALASLSIAEANWRPLGSERSKAWLRIAEPGAEDWSAIIERSRDAQEGSTLAIELAGVPLTTLAPEFARETQDPATPSRLTLQARLAAGPSGEFRDLRGMLSAGRGGLLLPDEERVDIAGAALSFAMGARGGRLDIPGGEVRSQSGNLRFTGAVDLGDANGVTLAGRVQGGVLPSVSWAGPVEVTGGELQARIDFSDRSISVQKLAVTVREATVSLVGQASLGGPAPGISLAVSFTPMPVGVARAFWPPSVAAKPRHWFDENVKSGMMGAGELRVALPWDHLGPRGKGKVLPSYGLIGTLPFSDAEFSPIRIFPTVKNAAGEVIFENATATFVASAGIMTAPGKGDVDASGTTFAIPELGHPEPHGDLTLQASGPAAALAALSDIPPLGIAAKRGIKADALSGHAQLALQTNLPLEKLTASDVEASFRLALTGVSSKAPIDNRLIADADIILEGSTEDFSIKGKARLDGIPASIDLHQGSAAAGQTAVTLNLDDSARERLGLGMQGIVTGPIQASITGAEMEGAQNVALDLKQTRINFDALGWEKGPGVPATLGFVMRKKDGATEISDVVLAGKGFGAKGSLSIGADGKLARAEITQLALRPGDRLSATVTAGHGGFDVQLRGASLDARGILRAAKATPAGRKGGQAKIRVDLDLDSVIGQNEVILSGVGGSLVVGGSGVESAALTGSTGRAGAFELAVRSEGSTRAVRLVSEDGGALVRFIGAYGKILGGRLSLDYSGKPGGAGTGILQIRDFRVTNETALAPAIATATPVANERGVRPTGTKVSDDLNFTQLRIPFRQKDGVVGIEEAALRGPIVGATASGTVNLPGGKVAISGTFIPAFGINNIAGAIPLIGGILGGGRDEGLVGITYKLFGPLDSPKLSMNPISAIAPGIFRKIFEYN